jgi:hypothetical protein
MDIIMVFLVLIYDDECFIEKMYGDQLFKEYLIQVTELNKNKNEFY